jgi:hypothetical protein
MIVALVLNSAKVKGVTRISIMGFSYDVGDGAIEKVHNAVLADPQFWIAVFDKVMVIGNL